MNNNKIEFFVGLFVIFSLFILFFIIFKISNGKDLINMDKKYRVKAIFRNIGNLKLNAKVTIYGVKIGYVNRISLVQNEFGEYLSEIEIFINNKFKKIPKDSTASIFMVNLLGENYIQLELGNDSEFLDDGDTILLTNQALNIEDLIHKFIFNK